MTWEDNQRWLKQVMLNCFECSINSGLTQEEIGQRMGYPAGSARKSVSQFLNYTTDPRLSMVSKFCDAVGVPLSEVLTVDEPADKVGV